MRTESPILWIQTDPSSPSNVETAIDSFEKMSGVTLHPVAKTHLLNGSGYADDPFPRMEKHDKYLFAQLSFPSSWQRYFKFGSSGVDAGCNHAWYLSTPFFHLELSFIAFLCLRSRFLGRHLQG